MRDRRVSLLLPAFTTLAAFGLRLYLLDGQSLWFDEGFALHLASQSLPGILEQNPVGWLPLHSVALHFWLQLVGQTPFAARFFSVFFGVLLVGLLYLLGRVMAGPITGVIASALGCVSPFLVYYAQEARTYALWLFLSLLSAYVLWRALREPERVRTWFLYTLVTALALYTHYLSVFLLPWGAIAVLREAAGKRRWKTICSGAASQACALALGAPLVVFARASVVDRYGFWRSRLSSLQVLTDLWYNVTTGGNLPWHEAWPPMLILACLTGVGLVSFRPAWNGALVGLYFLIPLTTMLILCAWRELYVARYLAVAVPAAYLLIARGLDRLWTVVASLPGRVFAAGGMTTLLCSGVLVGCSWAKALHNYFYSPLYTRDDFRSAARFISAGEADNDVIVMSGGGISTAFLPYYEGDLRLADLPSFGEWLSEDRVVEELNSLLSGREGGRVWLVLCGNEITDPQNLIVAQLWTYGYVVEAEAFPGRTGVRVLLFSPREELETFTFVPFAYERWRANFDNRIELLGFDIDGTTFEPGSDIHLALRWRALTALDEDYHCFAHLLDGANHVVAGHDKVPLNAYFRPTAWQKGEPLRDEYVLSLPHDLPEGTYELEVGWYSYPDLERLPVVSVGGADVDRVLLPPVVVSSGS